MTAASEEASLVLYHVLNDDDCAEVRRFIVQNQLTEKVQFRNIDRSEGATKDLLALQGNTSVPFLASKGLNYRGKDEILNALKILIS